MCDQIRVKTMIQFPILPLRCTLSIVLFMVLVADFVQAQQWQERTLPGTYESFRVAGNLTVPHMLAAATRSSLQSGGWRAWKFYTSLDAGNTWMHIDSGSFYDQKESGFEEFHQILYFDSTITRCIRHGGWEGSSYTCETRVGSGDFYRHDFPRDRSGDTRCSDFPGKTVGVPTLLPTTRGTLVHARLTSYGVNTRSTASLSMHEYHPVRHSWELLADTAQTMLRFQRGYWMMTELKPAASFGTPLFLALLSESGLYTSVDSSASWQFQESAAQTEYMAQSIFFAHPADSRVFFATLKFKDRNSIALYRSDDECGHWTMILDHPVTAAAVPLNAPRHIAAVRWHTCELSTDRGDTWQTLPQLPESCTWLHLDADGRSLHVMAANDRHLYTYDVTLPTAAVVPRETAFRVDVSPQPLRREASAEISVYGSPGEEAEIVIINTLGMRCGGAIRATLDARGTSVIAIAPIIARLTTGSYILVCRIGVTTRCIRCVVVE